LLKTFKNLVNFSHIPKFKILGRDKEKGTTLAMHIAKLKDGSKRVKKTFSMILERAFKMV
jgi:hypothetical protein